MKTIDDSLEWHDENELVRRLDVVEAVLNLADTIDDVVDVIMSVPTYKVQTSTNVAMGSGSISTKAERKTEPQTDCGDFADRLAYERGIKHAWEVAQKVFDSTVTFYEAEDVARQIAKDEPQTVLEMVLDKQTDEDRRKMAESVRKAMKDEPQTDCPWK